MSGCTVKSMEVQPNPCAKVVYTAHPIAESGNVQRTPAGAVHHAQCRFSFPVSYRGPLNCGDAGFLT